MTATVLENPTPTTAKTPRLTRARRTAILKALADPRRFELLERISKASCPLGCAQARAPLPTYPPTARPRRPPPLKALADPPRFNLLDPIPKPPWPLASAQAGAALPISAATL